MLSSTYFISSRSIKVNANCLFNGVSKDTVSPVEERQPLGAVLGQLVCSLSSVFLSLPGLLHIIPLTPKLLQHRDTPYILSNSCNTEDKLNVIQCITNAYKYIFKFIATTKKNNKRYGVCKNI